MKIVQNTLKIEEKFSDVPKKFKVGPKKVGSVRFRKTRHFFFGPQQEGLHWSFVAGLKRISSTSDFIHIFS